MKSVFPHRPGRILALLGFFVVAATLGFSGEKRVWVQYQAGAKGPVMAALANANGRVHYEFDNLEAVAVSLPEQALNGISRNPHVLLVEDDPIRMMASQTVPYGVGMVQAPQAIANGASGAGIKIGVIDSGVYVNHADLPMARITGWPTTGPDPWNRDPFSHGTHVVGTIAAVDNAAGVIGVAPGVGSIHMVKVFGDAGNWVNSSSLLAAVQNAVGVGSKIISMSLSGDIQSNTEKRGMDQLYNQGILLVAASGNDGNTRTAYPAGYASVIAVAAIDSNKVVADFSQKNSAVELSAPGVAVESTISYIDASEITVNGDTHSGHVVEFAARGSAVGELVSGGQATATNGSWSGKVVLVERGTNSFLQKVQNVQNSGGVACVIYNNVAGEELFATLGEGSSSTIPAIGLTQAQGQTLLDSVGASATVNSTLTFPASNYEAWDGTSMATPHVSAVAALVWSKYPTATNKQVRQAMTETAEDLGTAGRDNSYGFGLVRANAALTRLQQLVGGGGGGGDTTAPLITNLQTATAKGKAGSFTVSFTTNEPAVGTVSVTGGGSATTSLGTNHSVKVQGTKGVNYTGTVSATDPAGNQSAAQNWSFTP